jgi:hypothetical protein
MNGSRHKAMDRRELLSYRDALSRAFTTRSPCVTTPGRIGMGTRRSGKLILIGAGISFSLLRGNAFRPMEDN